MFTTEIIILYLKTNLNEYFIRCESIWMFECLWNGERVVVAVKVFNQRVIMCRYTAAGVHLISRQQIAIIKLRLCLENIHFQVSSIFYDSCAAHL